MALDELAGLGVAFVSLNEGIDTSTPAGRLQLHILGAIAEFERARCESASGPVWRGRKRRGCDWAVHVRKALQSGAQGVTVRAAAAAWGVPIATSCRRLSRGLLPPAIGANATASTLGVCEPEICLRGPQVRNG
jgi:DNA invertase Pin-like site-specific DNA recombinase